MMRITDFQLNALSGLPGRSENYWYFYSRILIAKLLHLNFHVISP